MNSPETGKLSRRLGAFDSIMLMIGIVIGSGIFVTTGFIAEATPSAPMILLVWVFGGLLTLSGALTYAELGAAMPEAGGQYVYLKEAYGPLSGFLFGWITFLVYVTGANAALGIAFAEYCGYFFPSLATDNIVFTSDISIGSFVHHYSLSSGQIVAVSIILLLSSINYIGVGIGKIVQNISTVAKLGVIFIFITAGFIYSSGNSIDYSFNPTGLSFGSLVTGFGISLIAVSWAFDAWNNITYVAGEIKNPQKNIPFALVTGTLIITAIYILMNIVYLRALPVEEMSGVVRIAEKASSALYGETTTGIISAAVLISVFGALNASILVGPRVYFAMAKDGLFFKRVAEIHPKFKTPGFAIIIQAVWSSLLALTGSFEQLFTFVMFVAIGFWIAAASAVFTLRRKKPDLPRPYKTWGYPVVPALFIAASAGIMINTLLESPVESLTGIGITLLGIPVYYYWKRREGALS